MAKRPHYALVGGFVLGAIAVLVIATFYFGSGKFFKRTKLFSVYFDDSVKGLSVGAPVSFRGAKIGSVKQIAVVYDPTSDAIDIPVVLELDADSIEGIIVEKSDLHDSADAPLMARLVQRGLRAQLAMESIVTGQLYVQFDFQPDSKPVLSGHKTPYPEIPTTLSAIDKLKSKVESIPVEEISQNLQSVLSSLDRILNSDELSDTSSSVNTLLKDLDGLVKDLDGQIGTLSGQSDLFIEEATGTARQAKSTIKNFEELLNPRHPITAKVLTSLDDFSMAARSVKQLADYLERHPETILRGKK